VPQPINMSLKSDKTKIYHLKDSSHTHTHTHTQTHTHTHTNTHTHTHNEI